MAISGATSITPPYYKGNRKLLTKNKCIWERMNWMFEGLVGISVISNGASLSLIYITSSETINPIKLDTLCSYFSVRTQKPWINLGLKLNTRKIDWQFLQLLYRKEPQYCGAQIKMAILCDKPLNKHWNWYTPSLSCLSLVNESNCHPLGNICRISELSEGSVEWLLAQVFQTAEFSIHLGVQNQILNCWKWITAEWLKKEVNEGRLVENPQSIPNSRKV